MGTNAHSGSGRAEFEDYSSVGLTRRVFYAMALATAVAVLFSLQFSHWRFSAGLFLGGMLSLLNLHWMKNSIGAAFNRAEEGTRPRIRMAQYVLRYFIVAGSVYIAYKLNLVSLPATMVGLSSFVIALFFEAFRESYFIITRREGTR